MGHLDDPLNTFWQLVAVPAGAARWSLITPRGVASNGGLVVSLGTTGSVLSGFEPSQDLLVSPLARSADLGSSWVAGILPGALRPVPDALASPLGTQAIALLRNAGGTVSESPGGLAGWRAVLTRRTLAGARSTARCGVEAITAVTLGPAGGRSGGGGVGGAAAQGEPVVGVACVRGGGAGIFTLTDGTWAPSGPSLPAAPAPTEVMRLLDTPTGVTALVRSGRGSARRLLAVWSGDRLRSWSGSPGLSLDGREVVATGTTPGGGLVVTVRSPAGVSAWVSGGPTAPAWRSLAAPPTGTTEVVSAPGGTFEALAVDRSVLNIFALGTGGWTRTQSLRVPIQYGSSG
jgi:hypothetical protein